MAMKQIESELGIGLFQRSNKGVKLTAGGEKFYRCCDEMMELYNNCLSEIHDAGVNDTFNVYITPSLYKMLYIMNEAPFIKENGWFFSYIERPTDEVIRMINENKGIALFSVHYVSKFNPLESLGSNLHIYNVGSEEKIVCICHKDNALLQYTDPTAQRAAMKTMKCVISSSTYDLRVGINKIRKSISVPDLESHKALLQQPGFYSILNYSAYRLHFDPNEYVVLGEKAMREMLQYYAVFHLPNNATNMALEQALVAYLENLLRGEE